MFGPMNKDIACGMWSPTYIIALAIVMILIIKGLSLSSKMSNESVRKILIFDAIFSSVTEIIKMIFIGITYGIKEVEFVPLYFCSLFIYMSFFSLSKNEKIKNTGLSFLFYGGIVGAACFFIYPSACIPNYPIYHFMCLRTLIYHGLMIYTGILIVKAGYYVPNKKHFRNYIISLGIICIFAYIFNVFFGYDYMYISKPIDIPISKMVYEWNPYLYPFIAMIVEVLVPFMVKSFIYDFIKYINKKRDEETIDSLN